MPVPKKKTTRGKRGQRRSHDRINAPSFSACPNCGAARQPHRVCQVCGHYAEAQVLEAEEA
ncbi:MAG: 50S ribosomal protein L32 [Nitrospinae bacterium]|nr:50S ribosomal protein L32 [Nitrospinota bacterium]